MADKKDGCCIVCIFFYISFSIKYITLIHFCYIKIMYDFLGYNVVDEEG